MVISAIGESGYSGCRSGRSKTSPAGRRCASPPEVLIGGSDAAFERLAASLQLAPIHCADSATWCLASFTKTERFDGSAWPRAVLDRARGRRDSGEKPALVLDDPPVPLLFRDPRVDPDSLTWAMSQLDRGKWLRGYASLVQSAGHQGRIARRMLPDPRWDVGRDRRRV